MSERLPHWQLEASPVARTGPDPLRASITVGLASVAVSSDPEDIIGVSGLGSCVAVMMRDPLARCSGMVHVVLPDSTTHKSSDILRFADTAIPRLVELMVSEGAGRSRLRCALAGGANLFHMTHGRIGGIGERNAEATREAVQSIGVTVVAQDLGGNDPRSVYMAVKDGLVSVGAPGTHLQHLCRLA